MPLDARHEQQLSQCGQSRCGAIEGKGCPIELTHKTAGNPLKLARSSSHGERKLLIRSETKKSRKIIENSQAATEKNADKIQ